MTGMTFGLLNVSAIAIISERYKGNERVQTQHSGVLQRLSGQQFWPLEVNLWSALAGLKAAFLVYGIHSILLLYLLFVLMVPKTVDAEEKHRNDQMTASQWRTALGLAVVRGVNRLV